MLRWLCRRERKQVADEFRQTIGFRLRKAIATIDAGNVSKAREALAEWLRRVNR